MYRCKECGSEHESDHGLKVHKSHTHFDKTIDRFWDKVNKGSKDECWIWNGAKTNEGYGQFWNEGSKMNAHRFILKHETEVDEEEALHLCNNPSCVNPDHLKWGTHSENIQQAYDDGRYENGFVIGNNKLTEDGVKEILRMDKNDKTALEISNKTGISRNQIYKIVEGKAWKDVSLTDSDEGDGERG